MTSLINPLVAAMLLLSLAAHAAHAAPPVPAGHRFVCVDNAAKQITHLLMLDNP